MRFDPRPDIMTPTSSVPPRSEALCLRRPSVLLVAMLAVHRGLQSDAIDSRAWTLTSSTRSRRSCSHPLYMPPDVAPFDISQYTPLYYLVVAALAKVIGVSGDDPIAVTRVARAFSTLVASGIAFTAYRFVRTRLGASARTGIIASAFIIAATRLVLRARVERARHLFVSRRFPRPEIFDEAGHSNTHHVSLPGSSAGLRPSDQQATAAACVVTLFLLSTRTGGDLLLPRRSLRSSDHVALACHSPGSAFRENLIDGVEQRIPCARLSSSRTLRRSTVLAPVAAALAAASGWLFSRATAAQANGAIAVAVCFVSACFTAIKLLRGKTISTADHLTLRCGAGFSRG